MDSLKIIILLLGLINLSIAATCGGCERKENPNKPELQNILRSALANYDSLPHGTDNERTNLIKVNSIVSQLSAFETKGLINGAQILLGGVSTAFGQCRSYLRSRHTAYQDLSSVDETCGLESAQLK